MAFSDYEHCHYCVADKQAGRPLPDEHGYKGLYVGDTDVPDHINVICSHHLKMLTDEITTLRSRVKDFEARFWVQAARELAKREAQHLAYIKALKDDAFHRHVACVGGCSVCDLNSGARCSLMQRLSYYDDVKADAPAFESWCYDAGGGAAADDGAVCKAHDAPAGHICRVTKDAWVCGDCESCNSLNHDTEGGEG